MALKERQVLPVANVSVQHYVVKSEPEAFSWGKLLRDGRTRWDGVRNYEARNHLRQMRKGDLLLFYHSGTAREVVGLARVVSKPYADPTATEGDWSVVDVEPVRSLSVAVSLTTIKAEPSLSNTALVRRPRLSVAPLTLAEFDRILALSQPS